jgi:probable rRNA maturation factor
MPENSQDGDTDSQSENNSKIEIIFADAAWKNLDFDPKLIANQIYDLLMPNFDAQNEEIALLLTNDEEVKILNQKWRNIDKATNVLSFEDVGNDGFLGNIAIALQYSQKEAINQGKTLKNHFSHLLIHAILHLLGYDHIDEAEAQEMENLEIEFLEKIGINNPYLIGFDI